MRSLLVATLVVANVLLCSAQQIIPTKPQPVCVFETGDQIQILTAQADLDFDGVQEENESPASWLTVEKGTYNVVNETIFPWAWVIAGRPGYDAVTNKLYVSVGDTVFIYNVADHSSAGVLSSQQAFGLSVSPDGQRVYATRRSGFDAPGIVEQITIGGQNPIPLQVGINPQQNAPYRTSSNVVGLAVVCEGAFGQNNGTLDFWYASQTGYSHAAVPVGDTPNYMTFDGDFVYVVLNGSHTIVKIDLNTRTAVDTFTVGTSGYNGPREAVINGDKLYVTTFNQDIRVFDKNTGQLLHTVQCNYRAEGLTVIGTNLFVCRSLHATAPTPETGVAVYSLDQVLTVAETAFNVKAHAAIFAVNSTLKLPMFEAATSLIAITVNGEQRTVNVIDENTGTVDLSSLPTGVYIVTDGKTSVVVGK